MIGSVSVKIKVVPQRVMYKCPECGAEHSVDYYYFCQHIVKKDASVEWNGSPLRCKFCDYVFNIEGQEFIEEAKVSGYAKNYAWDWQDN